MYVGHFAIGLAIKAAKPKIPALPIMLGIGFLDILDGIFIILGWDRVTPNLRAGPFLFFDLTFIDWDHSLAASLIWSAVWALLFAKHREVAIVAFVACFSHFLADLPVHNNDLALFPYSTEHFGFGLWGSLGTGSWVLEGLFAAALVFYAYVKERRRGVNLLWPAIVLVVLFFNLSPWLSPMKQIAGLSEPATHLLHGFLVTLGFLLPGALLVWLLNRAELQRASVSSP